MRKFQIISCALALCVFAGSSARAQDREAAPLAAPDARAELRALIEVAKEHAPEVSIARASLTSSRSALVNGRMAPFGNPYLEVVADHGNKGVTKDVNVLGTLWLPVELSGQRGSRGREAKDFVSLHAALVGQARAQAAGRLVRAYGSSVVAAERAAVLSELLNSAKAEASMIAERVKNGDAIARDASMAAVEAARHEVMLAEAEADLLRARGELAEVLGRPAPNVMALAMPPALKPAALQTFKPEQLPQSRSLAAEARFYSSSAERWRKEGQSALSVGLVAGRGDLGETRLGGGLAYAFPVFRANRPERARALAESSRALAEQRVHQSVAQQRLKLLAEQQAQLARAVTTLTQTALPAAELAVSAVQETYRAGKAEMLAVLLSRRELSALSLRRLELLEQGWLLVSEYVEITGELP
ncbi:MAG TPA: TolC family protein [Polyangiaceae bacterium]|nr:TolC family protein [Polyangiaceae bacterium]